MEARFNFAKASPGVLKAMLGISQYVRECGLPESLINLIHLRASQINGCAWCLDMHWKDLRAAGENEQRLIHWTPGANPRSIPIENAPRWSGQKQSRCLITDTCRTRFMKWCARSSTIRNV